MTGFQTKSRIETRDFIIECNFCDSRGNETAIAYERISIPRLKKSRAEVEYLKLILWHLLESEEFRSRNINQVFVLSADGRESLLRLQTRKAVDEDLTQLQPVTETSHNHFIDSIRKLLIKAQGSDNIAYSRDRLNVNSLKEFINSY